MKFAALALIAAVNAEIVLENDADVEAALLQIIKEDELMEQKQELLAKISSIDGQLTDLVEAKKAEAPKAKAEAPKAEAPKADAAAKEGSGAMLWIIIGVVGVVAIGGGLWWKSQQNKEENEGGADEKYSRYVAESLV